MVDLSEATVTKTRDPRIAYLHSPGTRADIIQQFNSLGFNLKIKGQWSIADGVDGPTYRKQLDTWCRNNTLVKYSDGQLTTWCGVWSFNYQLVPGVPGTDILIYYDLELHEARRNSQIDDYSMIGGAPDTPTEGNFSTWTQTWTVADATQTWVAMDIDEVNALIYFWASIRLRSRTLGAGSLGLDNAISDPTNGNLTAIENAISSIQHIYHIAINNANNQQFQVFKNGTLLFTSGNVGFVITSLAISITGKYIGIIAASGNLFLFTGA